VLYLFTFYLEIKIAAITGNVLKERGTFNQKVGEKK
jgi:hypothetical protein